MHTSPSHNGELHREYLQSSNNPMPRPDLPASGFYRQRQAWIFRACAYFVVVLPTGMMLWWLHYS